MPVRSLRESLTDRFSGAAIVLGACFAQRHLLGESRSNAESGHPGSGHAASLRRLSARRGEITVFNGSMVQGLARGRNDACEFKLAAPISAENLETFDGWTEQTVPAHPSDPDFPRGSDHDAALDCGLRYRRLRSPSGRQCVRGYVPVEVAKPATSVSGAKRTPSLGP